MAASKLRSADLLSFLSQLHKDTDGDEDPLKLMVIGVTGAGKSVLINNIVGKKVAKVGNSSRSNTQDIIPYKGTVKDVKVQVYDSPGLMDTEGNDKENLQKIAGYLKTIDVVVFCFSMITIRMTEVVKDTFAAYHSVNIPWGKTVIALTFADIIPHFTPTRPAAEVFCQKKEEWETEIRSTLQGRLGLPQHVVRGIPFCATTIAYDRSLPNGERWFDKLWLSILKSLEPLKRAQYIEMFQENIAIELLHSSHPGTSSSFTQMQGSPSSGKEEITMKFMHGQGRQPSQTEVLDFKESMMKSNPKERHRSGSSSSSQPNSSDPLSSSPLSPLHSPTSSSSLENSQGKEHPNPTIIITEESEIFTQLAEIISELVAKLLIDMPRKGYKGVKEMITSQWGRRVV